MPEGEPELEAMPRFLQRAHSAHLDLAIQMHGSGRITNQLITLLGARQTAGFYEPGEFCPDPKTYLQYPVDEPERWRHLRLMEFLGVPLRGDELEFPLGSDDWSELQALRERHHLGGEIVCIHAGARKPERRWPVERFAAVADALAGRGYQIVLTGSSGEAKPVESLALQMRTTPVNVAGKTTLGGLAALLASCRLLITNDTGVSHVATAVKAPSLVLFTADDHERWAPADRALHRLVLGAAAMPASLVLDQAVQQLEAIHAGAR
jgi:ADP-heptose:LPS heptosyltransferase